MKLSLSKTVIVKPKAPYNFKYSTQNPSHYPTPTGDGTDTKMWFTMRWKGEPIGVTFVSKGTVSKPIVEVTIYSKGLIDYTEILEELAYRFEWYKDYTEIINVLEKDKNLAPLLKKYKGMKKFCAENLYEYLMIAILLQNTNVKRTTKMTQVMLERYGDLLEFDGKKFYCFWTPKRILEVSEEELRSLKVGYRAKSFLRASQDYLELDEFEMRKLNDEDLRKALISIYGVGPASLDYIMGDVFHRVDVLHTIPPWEAKINSRLLNIETIDPKEQLAELKKRFGEYRSSAMHYIWMDLNWRHQEEPIEWYGKLMPY